MTENPTFQVSIAVKHSDKERAYGSAPTVSRIGLVNVEDELEGGEYWQTAMAAKAAASRSLNIASVKSYYYRAVELARQ
jgi:hypothetical protein